MHEGLRDSHYGLASLRHLFSQNTVNGLVKRQQRLRGRDGSNDSIASFSFESPRFDWSWHNMVLKRTSGSVWCVLLLTLFPKVWDSYFFLFNSIILFIYFLMWGEVYKTKYLSACTMYFSGHCKSASDFH